MASFASGRHALAVSDRSGQTFPYNEMVREWNGAWVHTSEYEPKQPQLEPSPVSSDPQGLERARPSRVALATPSVLDNNPISITNTSTTVTINQDRHQRSTGDYVRLYDVKEAVGNLSIAELELSTTLYTAITATSTSIVLSDSTKFPSTGYICIVSADSETGLDTTETIYYGANNTGTNTLSTITRGTTAPFYGKTPVSTAAAAHAVSDAVFGSRLITIVEQTFINDANSTETYSNTFTFVVNSTPSSTATGGGYFVFGGPVNDRA
jgi:hypothetical protein|tara:strand:- start:957 stop:1757 length:801 start_codon:yes stop_codon:yes gene_type:complete